VVGCKKPDTTNLVTPSLQRDLQPENVSWWNKTIQGLYVFFYNLFTKRTDKQYRYEIPREEPREAHGYLTLDFIAMIALSVYVTL
jgi:hypothetical protein